MKSGDYEEIINMYEDDYRLGLYGNIENVKKGLKPDEYEIVKSYFKEKGEILSVGCGGGREVFDLESLGFKVTGIDISPKMIEAAERNREQLKSKTEFRVFNIAEDTFPEKTFNYIVMWNQIFENIISSEERIKALRNCFRMLKSGGILSFTVFNNRYFFRNFTSTLKFYRSAGFRKVMSTIKQYLFWKLNYSLVRLTCFIFIRDYYRKSLQFINKKGRFSVKNKPGSVLAHVHSFKEVEMELREAGYENYLIIPFEKLLFDNELSWNEKGSVLLYVIAFKQKPS